MEYLREEVRRLLPYQPGEQPQKGGYLKLNTNENPFAPSPQVKRAIEEVVTAGALRLYPDPLAVELRHAASELTGHPPAGIICGNGSDDLLAMAVRACGRPGERLILTYPSYALYRVLAETYGLPFKEYDLTADFSLPKEIYLARGSLLFLSCPNAPPGTMFPAADLERLIAGFSGVVALDEAYIDFAAGDHLPFLAKYKNLLIVRTLSKSYSLAGLRVGYALGDPELIDGLCKVKDSYNLNALAIAAGAAALRDQTHMRRNRDAVLRERERLGQALAALGFQVWPSAANFLLVRHDAAAELYARLKGRQVLVRYFKARRLDDCLRITVGSRQDNDLLLQALSQLRVEKAF